MIERKDRAHLENVVYRNSTLKYSAQIHSDCEHKGWIVYGEMKTSDMSHCDQTIQTGSYDQPALQSRCECRSGDAIHTYLIVASPIGTLTTSTQPVMPPPDLSSLLWISTRRRPKNWLRCRLERRHVRYIFQWGRKTEGARGRNNGCPTRQRPLASLHFALGAHAHPQVFFLHLLRMCVSKWGV